MAANERDRRGGTIPIPDLDLDGALAAMAALWIEGLLAGYKLAMSRSERT